MRAVNNSNTRMGTSGKVPMLVSTPPAPVVSLGKPAVERAYFAACLRV
jgi:hypothetical protein